MRALSQGIGGGTARRRNFGLKALRSCGPSGVKHLPARKLLTQPETAVAIAPCGWESESVGLTPSKKLCSPQSQVSGDLSSREDRKAAAADPGEGAPVAPGPPQGLCLSGGEEGAPVFLPAVTRR